MKPKRAPYSTLTLKLFVSILITFSVTFAQKYNFALVLSGGGARGLAQIGVLKALEQANLKPDLIVATSMGAIVGSLYAAGHPIDTIETWVHQVNWGSIFANSASRNKLFVNQKNEPVNYLFELRMDEKFRIIPPSSISYGQSFYDLLAGKLLPAQCNAFNNFDNLYVPLRIIATDIVSGKKVVFSQGNLMEAVRASCGVPLAFSPVKIDSMLLMDGGLTSNIPVESALESGARFIVVVDVTSPLWDRRDLENPVRLVDQLVSIGMKEQKNIECQKGDLIIRPELSGFTNTNFSNIDKIIDIGYEAAIPHLQNIRFQLNLLSYQKSQKQFNNDLVIIPSKIKISGNHKTSSEVIKTASGILPGDTLDALKIRKAIQNVYSTDLFTNVNIDCDTLQNLKILVDEKKYWRIRTGLRYDEYHLLEGFIQPGYENLFGMGLLTDLHMQYGLRREKYALELKGNHLFATNFANTIFMQAYISKESVFNPITSRSDSIIFSEMVLRKTGLLTLLAIQLGKFSQAGFGINLERFRIQKSDPNVFGDVLGLRFREGLPYFLMKLVFDTMNKYPFATSGQLHQISIGGTSKTVTRSDEFVKIHGSSAYYFTFLKKHTISPQLRFAWSSNKLPAVEKFYIGGSIPEEKYRDISIYNYVPFWGLKPRAFSGDNVGVLHLDYTFSPQKRFHLQTGIDWGYAWQTDDKDVEWVESFMKDAPLGFGLSIAYETIIGPTRFSYGRLAKDYSKLKLNADNQFYMSIGHDF